MGGGSTNAQSIADFNECLDLVRKAHLQTIKHLRHFWSIPVKKSTDREHVRRSTVDQMWNHIQVRRWLLLPLFYIDFQTFLPVAVEPVPSRHFWHVAKTLHRA